MLTYSLANMNYNAFRRACQDAGLCSNIQIELLEEAHVAHTIVLVAETS